MQGVLLSIDKLCKRFADYQALCDISFHVLGGEILGVIGPNGAGKTTLLECLAGLMPVDRGVIAWQGSGFSAHQRKELMFYMPDGVLPYGAQYVIQVLDFFGRIYGLGRERLQQVIDQLALTPVLMKRIDTLSKGYRRRLLLAIALLAPQPLLLLDEPFDGLDLRQTQQVMAILQEARGGGRTLILSIHQLTEAERICDRLVLLAAGRLLGCGALDDLRRQAGLAAGDLEEVFLALT
jgi:ABC-type multidrug transport system ATPase subunit